MGEWYYVGHYGQLGPLTFEQMDELIQGGVIARDTYVWKAPMPNWVPAESVGEFLTLFAKQSVSAPPPVPPPTTRAQPGGPTLGASINPQIPYGAESYSAMAPYQRHLPVVESDRSRVAGGVLNILLPGVGRMYLGYSAIGVLQLVVSIFTCGVGTIWPFVDGILILTGVPKLDGFGRVLKS